MLYGNNKTIEAVKFCRLIPNNSAYQREQALNELVASLQEQKRR